MDDRPVAPEALRAMVEVLRHRGPDDEGVWNAPGIGLAHTRLSIIDLAGSPQPMASADGRWVLAFNGEIFNYRELRKDLAYPFRTDGDTEVILAGVAAHGIDFIEKLVGQFAFALHDTHTATTHLVRDRLGVLPLNYLADREGVVFASEIKAIFAALSSRPSVDMASLDAYLYGRSVPAPYTLFEGVSKVPPAHRAEISSNGTLTLHRYWRPPAEDRAAHWSPERAIDAVDGALDTAVQSALVADVPVGAYLSGGIDSSLIVAKVAALGPGQKVQTFAAGFGDPRHDELSWASLVSGHVGTDHHEVKVAATDFEALWPKLTWHRDAPISEPADIAVFRLAQDAREHVSVVLSGEGGDELFAGYPKYRAARSVALAARVPAALRGHAGRAIDNRLPARLGRARIALRAATAATAEERHRSWFAPFTGDERARLLHGVAARAVRGPDTAGADVIRAMLLTDLWSWLPDNLLERGDRMSMAASLELRPPLLDHRLVELAFSLPSTLKVRSGTTKWLLKEVARRYLPAEVVDRRKVGFRVPLDAWFRSGLREAARDRLTGPSSFVAQTFDRRAVSELLDRHDSGRFNEESRIWTLLSLEIWHETFIATTPAIHSA